MSDLPSNQQEDQATQEYERVYNRRVLPYRRSLIPSLSSIPPSPPSLRLRIVQYNILAQGLINRRTRFSYLTKAQARFRNRRNCLLEELQAYDGDVLCFQEMDHYADFWREALEDLGYQAVYRMKGHVASPLERQVMRWGICIALRNRPPEGLEDCKWEIETTEDIMLRDLELDPTNTHLEMKELSVSNHFALAVMARLGPYRVLIVTTHLFWRPEFGYVRWRHLQRIREVVDEMVEEYERMDPDVPVSVIFAGDFNTSPNDAPYCLHILPAAKGVDFSGDEYMFGQLKWPVLLEEWFKDELFPVRQTETKSLEELIEERDEAIRRRLDTTVLDAETRLDRIWFSAYEVYQDIVTDESDEAVERYRSEPAWTTKVRGFQSVLDYVLFERRAVLRGEVEIESILEIQKTEGLLPNDQFASDHMSLVVDVALFPERKLQRQSN